ncbi:DUF86 domain-containing protein [Enterococcus sp. 1001283B150225_161107_E12]|uniref:HepT-like ribonuclease domain-containing protein n=1 Tax=Enterococcus sp. 1001283B150225_161107_E12 TaxID=2787145 RepID=UPI00189EEECB|nr:HepT-like ribonuclease domain-containing protein [Enterococcus sp. 1001283B150225_161107_E12]
MKNKMKADLRILYGSLTYCDDIDQTLNRFDKNYEVFINDRVFFHAVSMSLMQVGEMSNKLSDTFKEETSKEVDWRRLKYIRNLFAHAYSNVNERTVWEFATVFIPVYATFCRSKIKQLERMI